MKQTRKRLRLEKETVRQIGTVELGRVVAADGQVVIARDTEAATCPWTHVAASGECQGG